MGGINSVGGSPTEGFLGLLDSEKVFGFHMGGMGDPSCMGGGSDFHSPAPASVVFPNEKQRIIRFLAAHGNGQIRSQLHGGDLDRMGGSV